MLNFPSQTLAQWDFALNTRCLQLRGQPRTSFFDKAHRVPFSLVGVHQPNHQHILYEPPTSHHKMWSEMSVSHDTGCFLRCKRKTYISQSFSCRHATHEKARTESDCMRASFAFRRYGLVRIAQTSRSMPARTAMRTSSVELFRSSRFIIRARCTSTVRGLIPN